MTRPVLLLLAPLLSLVACADGDGNGDGDDPDDAEALTCDVLEGDNCWARAVAAVDACTADVQGGVFASDLASCTYDGGESIVFDPPLDPAGFQGDATPTAAGTLRDTGGADCATVAIAEDDIRITANGEETRYTLDGNDVVLSCPDGTTFRGGGLGLFDCLGSAPGLSWSGDPSTFASVSLLGGDGALVFSCRADEPDEG
jgi:hypothetical protein